MVASSYINMISVRSSEVEAALLTMSVAKSEYYEIYFKNMEFRVGNVLWNVK
jgi:hypothetical protein